VGTGSVVSYMYDSGNRLIGRTQNGVTTQYVYANLNSKFQLSASRSGNVTSFYFYDTFGNLMGMERGGVRYSILTDLVGSPRIVLNEQGVTVKQINYSAFGEILSDSNTNFELPIGFAGGIVDTETKLVKFGYRDYDPSVGRWTARDPILFEGGQGNLYVYVGNSPLMYRDPEGLWVCTLGGVIQGVSPFMGGQLKGGVYVGTDREGNLEFGVYSSIGDSTGLPSVSTTFEAGFSTGNVEGLEGKSSSKEFSGNVGTTKVGWSSGVDNNGNKAYSISMGVSAQVLPINSIKTESDGYRTPLLGGN
jgi:RHS repeat-associated protein